MKLTILLIFVMVFSGVARADIEELGDQTRAFVIFGDSENQQQNLTEALIEQGKESVDSFTDGILQSYINQIGDDVELFQIRGFTGQTSLLIRSLGAVLDEASRIRQGGYNMPKDPPDGTHPQCVEAYQEKRKEFSDLTLSEKTTYIDSGFGKIDYYTFAKGVEQDSWVGFMAVCTWFGTDNYYILVSIDELKAQPGFVEIPHSGNDADPFDVDMSLPQEVLDNIKEQEFKYKLHAKGRSITYLQIYANSVLLPEDDEAYITSAVAADGSGNIKDIECLDIFLEEKPTGIQSEDLISGTYCMSLCDGFVLNTGK